MKPVVLPPYEVQQRAWECAYDMRERGYGLPIEHRITVEVAYRAGPEWLGWLDLTSLFVLHRHYWPERV